METIEKPKARITFQETPKGLYPLMLNVEKYVKESGLPVLLLELIKIRASQINGCGYCLDMHHKDATKLGETFQRMYLLPAWEESPCYSDAEKAVLNLTDVLTQISMHDPHSIEAAYNRVAEHYSKEEIATIILAINQINSWNRFSIAFGNIPGTYNG